MATSTFKTGEYQAILMFEKQLKSSIQIPVVDTSHHSPEHLATALDDLARLHLVCEDLSNNLQPFVIRGSDGIGYASPLGIVIGQFSDWCGRQRSAILETLEAAQPEDRCEAVERLVGLIRAHVGTGRRQASIEKWVSELARFVRP